MTTDQRLGEAAVTYAACGFRVLPLHYPLQTRSRQGPGGVGCSCGDPGCGPVGKHPLIRNGLHDATSDPARIARWWRRWPNANIGLVTGELVDVLDVDGPAGRAALRRYATTTHDLRLDGPLVRTGRGWHHYLAASGSGNRAGLLEGVDWRGRGGYVVVPPSQHPGGSRYRWLRPLTRHLPDTPWSLRNLLASAREQRPEPVPRFHETATGHPYGQAALQRELAAVAGAPKGRRNHTLYQAGIRLYSLVAGGILDHGEVHTGLLAAAATSRLLTDEPPRPIAPWPRPNAPAWPTPAASQPTTKRGDWRRPHREPGSPDAATTGSAMARTSPAGTPAPSVGSPPLRGHGADHHRLPAAPVLLAIQRRARLRRQSLRELLGPELFGAYGNAQAAGTISLVTLARFCDDVLGWHPRMLYGEAYDQATVASHP